MRIFPLLTSISLPTPGSAGRGVYRLSQGSRGARLCLPGPLAAFLFMILGLLFASQVAVAQCDGTPLILSGLSTPSGAPGTPVTITGSGFPANPDNLMGFVYDDDLETGAFADASSGGVSTYDLVLMGARQPFFGNFHLWQGSWITLPQIMVQGKSTVYLVEKAEVFIPCDKAQNEPLFEVTGSSPVTGSQNLHSNVIFDLGLSTMRILKDIVLDAMVEGGSASGSTDPGDPSGGLRLRTGIRVVAGSNTLNSFDLAEDMALILNQTYGLLGVEFHAVDHRLVVSWDTPVLKVGFGVLEFSEP